MAFESKPITFEEFIDQVKVNNPYANKILVEKAFRFAEDAHKGQKRTSGEDFFIHPLEVARILVNLKADTATICAALLHDTVEDTSTSEKVLRKEFGDEIAKLVDGLTKISGRRFNTKEEYTAENMRKMLLAATKDIRVITIRLADRLHNMRTLATLRPDKRKRIALETLQIYAPIAHKLGMWKIKGELEDLSFRYLDFDNYVKLKENIAEKRVERERSTNEIVERIREHLKSKGVSVDVAGRAKYFYSIYKKMIKANIEFDDMYDLIAIRILTNNKDDCYKVLDMIHSLFEPKLDRFKDYIKRPKANEYRSIHTVVKSGKKIIEVQIRTKEMHLIAEDGIAAHWKYKGAEKDSAFDRKIMWLKQILEWLRKSKNSREFLETLKIDLFENEIIVLTPAGDPISLPERATPVDFAYAVHTGIGNHCSKAKVNGKIVPLDHPLASGDMVEILTSNRTTPSRSWLNFTATSKAKSKIRGVLGIEADIRQGKNKDVSNEDYDSMRAHLVTQIRINSKKAPLKMSGCCEPDFGDDITGLRTKDGKITVHRSDCVNIHSVPVSKRVLLDWIEPEDSSIRKVRIFVTDRPGVLAKILNALANIKVDVRSVNTRVRKKKIILSLKLDVKDDVILDKMFETLKKIDDITDISSDDGKNLL